MLKEASKGSIPELSMLNYPGDHFDFRLLAHKEITVNSCFLFFFKKKKDQ